MIFAALLQVTPAASPDCNFMGLASEEQDAEVTARRRTVVPPPQSRGLRCWQRVRMGWELFWKKPVKRREQSRRTARLARALVSV